MANMQKKYTSELNLLIEEQSKEINDRHVFPERVGKGQCFVFPIDPHEINALNISSKRNSFILCDSTLKGSEE